MEHMLKVLSMSLVLFAGHSGGHQNLPPGVHPQHYQQVPMHQVPVHQQMPVQQQVPMQQHPQQVPVQHMPVQHQMGAPGVPMQQQQQHGVPMQQQPQQFMEQQQGHGHHHGGRPQVLNVANIADEKQHIEEHLTVPLDTSKMTEQELQFHYFKLHDADNNNKLDGCELIKSLIHWHEQGQSEPGKPPVKEKLFKDDELVSLIDPILALDDANSDGYIDYPEFVRAQQKAAAAQPKS